MNSTNATSLGNFTTLELGLTVLLYTQVRWRADGRCGEDYTMPDDSVSECDPRGERPCCSDYGYCGISPSHCTCRGCIDYRDTEERCHLWLDETEGMFESPNYPATYPAGQDCTYDIVKSDKNACGVKFTGGFSDCKNQVVSFWHLLVEDMDVEAENESGFCQKDWLAIESCVPEGGSRFCGNQTGSTYHYAFQPGATAMRLAFHADKVAGQGRGFRIRYKLLTDCTGLFFDSPASIIPGSGGAPCFTRIEEASGTINTPYHPKKYPENLDCVYEFSRTIPLACGVKMRTISFELEPAFETPFGGACSDYFHMPSCGFLCGKLEFTWIARFQPNATALRFQFHSDEASGYGGFLISFEQVTEC